MLRTCERASSAGIMKVPVSSPSGKRTSSCSAKTFHKDAHCFPTSRSSSDFDRRSAIFFGAPEGTVNFKGDTIILISGHEVLTFGSCFEYESGRHGTCFAMNSDGVIMDWNGIAHIGIVIRRHSVPVRLHGLRKCQVYASYFYCHQMTLDHGTRETQWLWIRYCPNMFQDFAGSCICFQSICFQRSDASHKTPNNL